MKKKLYEKPSCGVIEMRQKPALLVGSVGDGNINPMGNPEDL